MLLDCLLPSTRPVPPPFSQDECQELIKLLETLGMVISLDINAHANPHVGHSNLSESQNVVHTRIVSRILMRLGNFQIILPTDDFRF